VTWWCQPRQVRPSAGTETEAREWATSGKKTADGPNPAVLPAQAPGADAEAAHVRDSARCRARGLACRRLEHHADHGGA
jgi:hypothetical protein